MSQTQLRLTLRKLQAGLLLASAAACLAGALAPASAAPTGGSNWDHGPRPRTLADKDGKDENDVVIKAEELPKSIRDYIAKDLPGSKITEARKDYGNKEHKGDKFVYEVDVTQGKKEYEYKFSQDGKLLKKREEAGDEPAERKGG